MVHLPTFLPNMTSYLRSKKSQHLSCAGFADFKRLSKWKTGTNDVVSKNRQEF